MIAIGSTNPTEYQLAEITFLFLEKVLKKSRSMLLIPKLKLGYQYVPKVATTSIFNWMYKAYGEYESPKSKRKNYKREFFRDRYNCESLEDIRRAMGDYLHVGLTRDPIWRFLSVYTHRVVINGELGINGNDAFNLLDAGLPLNPQLDELIQSLEGYFVASPLFFHHARKQIDFLGEDLSVYNHLLDISESDRMIDLVRLHWIKNGMHQPLANADERLPLFHYFGDRIKIGLDRLSHRSFERLLEYYQPDYAAIPSIDLESIQEQFIQMKGGSKYITIEFPKHRPNIKSIVRIGLKYSRTRLFKMRMQKQRPLELD